MLKNLEMLFGGRYVAGALKRAGQDELGRGMKGVDGESFFENRDGLVVLLQILVADALEIEGIRIRRIEFARLLKAFERRLKFVPGALGQAQVVPGLRAAGVKGDGFLEVALCFLELLQG